MPRFFVYLCVSLALLFTACSASETTVSEQELETTVPAKYPAWFNSNGVQSDSLSFHVYSTAVAADSLRAIRNAQRTARTQLESHISDAVEEVRSELEENGNSQAASTSYILMLNEAVDAVDTAAEEDKIDVWTTDQHFRAFVQISLSKAGFTEILKNHFEEGSGDWAAFSGTSAYSEELQ
ncbi:hypothetical protein [Gracilimonas mengyeensis]|uniref:LPP20 lipoprotein n=1 Tax=Gracilimonas mengyeensis TaxID=1302730 RepID=A0A521AAQ8_9BACT|nr:hypothetical protein [Gracilimonas mengyeensis]SMO31810.1 hypothetical protein SAMN06265219_1014 [Gracilimonas mengyeensis]